MEEMVDAAGTGYSGHWASHFPCRGSRADWFQPLPSPFLGSPSSTGSEALQCSRQALAKAPPSPGRIHHLEHTAQGSAFRTRQLLCSLLKISSEKQTGFVPLHPVNAHKKISTLYKEQQRYNLNMHPATNHIYRETAYTNRTGPFITLQFWWSFWRKSQQMNKVRLKEVDVGSESNLVWNVTQHPHLSPAHTSRTLPATHSSSHDSWTPFLYRGRFLSMFWYCTTVNMVLITRNNLQRLISIIQGHNLIVGIQAVQ